MTRQLNLPSVMELGKGVLKSLHTAMPSKTAVSPRSSPLVDVSRGVTSATQPQKFHNDDVKSVRNPVINADWTTEYLLCFSYCLRMTDKRQKAKKVKRKRDESTAKQSVFVQYIIL